MSKIDGILWKEMTTIKRAGAIIYNQNCSKVVVVMNKWSRYHKEEKWGFPKGHVKDGESGLAGAVREVFEETGLAVLITPTTS